MDQTDEKKNIIIPLLQTTTTPLHNSNQHNYTIDIHKDKPITISFQNINYVIGNEDIAKEKSFQWPTKTFPFWRSTPPKQILTNISGIFTSGMNAILGKSFFFNSN